jgi:hypothetical protein
VSIDVRHQSLRFPSPVSLERDRAAYSLTPNDQSGIIAMRWRLFALRVQQHKLVRPSAFVGLYARSLRFVVGNTVQQAALNVHSGTPEK